MSSDATSSTIDAIVSGIAVSPVPADQAAHIHPNCTATSFRTNLFPQPLLVTKSDIPVHLLEVAAMETQFIIEEPGVWNAPLLSKMHVAWVRYQRISMT